MNFKPVLFLLALFPIFLTGQVDSTQATLPPKKTVINGVASWYGYKSNNRITASGERFYNDSLTAAHKTLPFGTIAQVRNLKNDSIAIIKITDRLPANSIRTIDLSYGTAKKLNFVSAGLANVEITILYMPEKKSPVARKVALAGKPMAKDSLDVRND